MSETPGTLAHVELMFARWLPDPDPIPTRAVLCAFLANTRLTGEPVWLMLVGGSGAGKTVRLTPLYGLPGIVPVSTITSDAALLSATPKADVAENATGGLLRQVGDQGILVFKDFTTILSMNRDKRNALLAALREAYDGQWVRSHGVDGAQTLTWDGHCGALAGCTTAIDSARVVMDHMGTRFVMVRLTEMNSMAVAAAALGNIGSEQKAHDEITAAVHALLEADLAEPHGIDARMMVRLASVASLASKARSPVERDARHVIMRVDDKEEPSRLVQQIGLLFQAGGMLGLSRRDSWEVARRAALDSIPKLRGRVVAALGLGARLTTAEVARRAGHPPTTTLYALEELVFHGIATEHPKVVDPETGDLKQPARWSMADEAAQWWRSSNPRGSHGA